MKKRRKYQIGQDATGLAFAAADVVPIAISLIRMLLELLRPLAQFSQRALAKL